MEGNLDPLLQPIEFNKILAVEGQDEENFFGALFRHIGILNIDIRQVGGKNQFPRKLPVLKVSTGFNNVTHLAVVRDRNSDNAFQSIVNILKRMDLTPPDEHGGFSSGKPKVGVFIMPGETIGGTMLEDLCLRTVREDDPAMKCVREFTSCISELENPPKNISKAKVQTFLAAQPEIVNSVGLGAEKNYWDFESSVLDELKQFLGNLR
ncbi:MAG: hypothetical protein AMJ79_01690 [Phycisphaerae bacterium SM23_30]|nr:MAG: hypothetical protein AMJ79_01690 [Phycisphaerae bacterium SM23_30]